MAIINLANINSTGGSASSAKERDFAYTLNGDYTVKSKSSSAISKANITVSVPESTVYSDVDGMKYAYISNTTDATFTEFPDNWRFAPRTGENCKYMFLQSYIKSLDLQTMDVSKVTNMRGMFLYDYNLQTLNINGFNTELVADMASMFNSCRSLTSLDVGSFSTNNVEDMSDMFGNCQLLETLNLINFNTRNVTDMSYMFYNCSALRTLNISNFNTSRVTTMRSMFYECRSLNTNGSGNIDLSFFDTSNVYDMYCMFYDCYYCTTLNISSFDTTNVTNISAAFNYCRYIQNLYLGEGFGKATKALTVNLSSLTNWTNSTVKTSLLSLYDRVTNGLTTKMTFKLSSNTKAVLSDEDISTLTARGYVITT